MKNWFMNVKGQHLLFIVTIILTIIGMQVIIQFDLKKQNEDAQLINLAGKQGMYGQRIAKLVLYLRDDLHEKGKVEQRDLDTLQQLLNTFEKVHFSLLKGSSEFGLSDRRSPQIDSLLKANTPHLAAIITASGKLVEHPDLFTAQNAAEIIGQNELKFLNTMEQTVTVYQREAEEKLKSLKKIEIGLSALAIIILVLEFLFIFTPIVRKLKDTNKDLALVNHELASTNEELQATSEELQSNLDHVTMLQQHLQAREQQYREVVENAGDMIYELDEDGTFSFVNKTMEQITGYTRENLLHKPYWDLIHADHKQRVIEFYKEKRAGRKELSYLELPIVTSSGKIVWVGQNVKMFYTGEWVTRVSVIARDITLLKDTQQKFAESEQLFRSLAEQAPVGIFQTEKTGKVTYLNKKWCEITGMDERYAKGDGWANAVVAEDREKVFSAWEKAIQEGREFNLEYRYLNPRTGIRWVHGKASKQIDGENKVTGYVGTVHDITELKDFQRKLSESEKLYRELSENSQDLTTLNSIDGTYVYLSASVTRLLGYEPDELMGTSPYSIIHSNDFKLVTNPYRRTVEGHRVQNIEYRVKRKDGQYIWMDMHTQPITDKNGNITGFQTVSRDITLRKELEIVMKEAKEKAEDATKAKSQFLSMMSHEIRTPMNAIIGLTNLLLQETPREDQVESLNLLKFSGENLLTIINDILDFSKIEAGKITLEAIHFNFHSVLSNIIQIQNQRAKDKGINLYFNYHSKVPHIVIGDQVRIVQVIHNLLSNAIKFTEKGYVELSVTSLGKEENKNLLHVAVKDTGIGIDQEKVQQIFESFTQARSDTTRKFGGTGLGLSITKRLLNLMGSEIKVDSKPGYGTQFTFTLSLEEGNAEELAERPMAENKDHFAFNEMKVLLVEDNRVNQIVASNFLKKWGVKVIYANHGKEALTLILDKSYHLVLMDLQMPEMDGFETTQKIRSLEDPYFKKVPIIALTASAMSDTKNKVLQTGMNSFVTKPFRPEELHAAISQYASKEEKVLQPTPPPRTTSIKLDVYADGDAEFKRELTGLLIKNINELQQALLQSLRSQNVEVYSKACHKAKTTMAMLGHAEFQSLTDEIKAAMTNKNEDTETLAEKVKLFDELCEKMTIELEEELKAI